LRRLSPAKDRPAIFAARFALSHACWLVTYPLSGWLMTRSGAFATAGVLSALAASGLFAALRPWPAKRSGVLAHADLNLPLDHPHLQGTRRHAHPFVVDSLHPRRSLHL
jgi:hypothetical protein